MYRDSAAMTGEPEVTSLSNGSNHLTLADETLEQCPSDHLRVPPSPVYAHDVHSVNTDRELTTSIPEHEHGDINFSFLFSDEYDPLLQNRSKADADGCSRDAVIDRYLVEQENTSCLPIVSSYHKLSALPKGSNAELDAHLNDLTHEREAILSMSHTTVRNGLAKLHKIRKQTLKNAYAERIYRRESARAQLQVDVRKANADFTKAKAQLRQNMLAEKNALCKRMESVGVIGVANEDDIRYCNESFAFVDAMERNGLIALASTPDKINRDLTDIVHAVRISQLRQMVSRETDSESSMEDNSGEH